MRLVHFMKQAVRDTAQKHHVSLHTATFLMAGNVAGRLPAEGGR